jgi:hypothetical protein
VFRLGSLPKEDPALAALTRELSALGLQPELTSQLLEALRGVDHLGTLLRVDRHVASLLDEETEKALGSLFAHAAKQKRGDVEAALGAFLDAHAAEADLGLRLEASSSPPACAS